MSFHNLNFSFLMLFFNYKLILGIFFLILIYFLLPFTQLKIPNNSFFKFKDFNTFDKLVSFFVVFVLFLTIIFLLLLRRISNFNNNLDLVDIFFKFQYYFKESTYFEIFSTILFYFSLIILYLILFKFLKKYFFIHSFKVHIYLLSKETLLHCDGEYGQYIITLRKTPQSYYYFVEKYDEIFNIIEKIPYKIIKPVLPLLVGEDCAIEDKYFNIGYRLKIKVEYFFIYLLIFSFFFDIIFNYCYITKIFYILPFAFVYYLLYTFRTFSCGSRPKRYMSIRACMRLSFFYYTDLIKVEKNEENGSLIYYFSNGYFCGKKNIEEMLELMHEMGK